MEKILQLTENDFDNMFVTQKNHLNDNASWTGCMYETYGEELRYCFELSQKENRVWTIIESDDDVEYEEGLDEDHIRPNLYVVSGFHYVNRLGFLVTDKPYTEEIEVKIED